MLRIVVVQVVALLAVAAVSGAIAGSHAGFTALLGGLAVALPNGLLALNLALLASRGPHTAGTQGAAAASANVLALLLGEFFKVALTVGLLVLVVWGYRDVVWPVLIISVGAVLLIQPVALAWRQS
jgi:F0F1-type ATP synthase assembly protein I